MVLDDKQEAGGALVLHWPNPEKEGDELQLVVFCWLSWLFQIGEVKSIIYIQPVRSKGVNRIMGAHRDVFHSMICFKRGRRQPQHGAVSV